MTLKPGLSTQMVSVAVLGARGYLGRELIRLLLQHPQVESVGVGSQSSAGEPLGKHLPAFRHVPGLTLVPFDHASIRDADAVFMALGHGEAKSLVPTLDEAGTRCIIDLSRDFRTEALAANGWTYGLADLDPVAKGTRRIANPGCYPTASLLATAPALRGRLLADGPIIVDGKSGVSGAGATVRADLHFAETNESVRAYKVLGHDHGPEIRGAAAHLEGRNGNARGIRFTPHLVPQNRGLLATVYAPIQDGVTPEMTKKAYQDAYQDSAFVAVVDEPDTSHVRHSNRAEIAVDVDVENGLMVARGAIDNLVKGGSGQAVQNFNDSFGYPATTGLTAVGGGP
jgi:N-acetyl-gamma-glutamyl-phosphate reductase